MNRTIDKIIIQILREFPSGWDDSDPNDPEEKWCVVKQDTDSFYIYFKSTLNKIIPIKKTQKAIQYFTKHSHTCNIQPIIHTSEIDLEKDIHNPRATRITEKDRQIANKLYGNKNK